MCLLPVAILYLQFAWTTEGASTWYPDDPIFLWDLVEAHGNSLQVNINSFESGAPFLQTDTIAHIWPSKIIKIVSGFSSSPQGSQPLVSYIVNGQTVNVFCLSLKGFAPLWILISLVTFR